MKHPENTNNLFDRVAAILEQARSNVIRSVNSQMVIAYWLIGREIVEEEQHGASQAGYGEYLIQDLSKRLGKRYGKGYSVTNLKYFRQFYLTYRNRDPKIGHAVRGRLPMPAEENGHAARDSFDQNLSWTHYRLLLKVENEHARSFYEIEAAKNRWSSRQLERQINSLLFERLLKSRDKEGLLQLANQGQIIEKPIDTIKDPYVLEFLDLPESHRIVESDLENALISHLQEFLLELGSGFAFVGRQKRLTLDGDIFYPDLVFYHIKLKCYVVIDLKVAKLTHGDLGQMQMYVHYYDREVRSPEDNPTIGLILCTDKNDSVVKYVLDEENRQIFASRYKLVLPDEQKLAAELRLEMNRLLAAESSGKSDKE
jgi:predicted nuclease of restriction endonuclease-like (RecB) superfamily